MDSGLFGFERKDMQNYTGTLLINCCLMTAAGKTALCPSAFRQLASSVLHLRWGSSSVFIHILDKIKVNRFRDLLSAEKNRYVSFLQRVQSPAQGSKHCQGAILLSRRGSQLGFSLPWYLLAGAVCDREPLCFCHRGPSVQSQLDHRGRCYHDSLSLALPTGNYSWFVVRQEEFSAAAGLGTVRETKQESTGCQRKTRQQGPAASTDPGVIATFGVHLWDNSTSQPPV